MTLLNEIQIQLAEQLLLSVINREPTIYYHELAQRVRPKMNPRNVGKNIGEVSKLCHEFGLPLLSAKVINVQTQAAGEGFYPLYGELGIDTNGRSPAELYREEKEKIRLCKEWNILVDFLGLDLDMPQPTGKSTEYASHPLQQSDNTLKVVEEILDNSSNVESENLLYPEQINSHSVYSEGGKLQITINSYERNEKARKECIHIHGTRCTICGFDFGEVFGEEFEGKIHVHHIKPLSETDDRYLVDPETDLIPVCPNCHVAIHSKPSGVYSVEEIKGRLAERK